MSARNEVKGNHDHNVRLELKADTKNSVHPPFRAFIIANFFVFAKFERHTDGAVRVALFQAAICDVRRYADEDSS